MEKFIKVNGSITRVTNQGEGKEAIVLLHGYLEALEVWEEFRNLLAPEMRVVTMDLPGHGVSQVKSESHSMEFLAECVAKTIKTLEITKAVVVGHSMGGYLLQELITSHPELLAGGVMLHASVAPDDDTKRENRVRQIEVVEKNRKELLTNMIPNRFAEHNRRELAETIEEFKEIVAITENEGIKAILRGMNSRQDLTTKLQESEVPLMLIFGRHDDYISIERAEESISTLPKAEVIWLENSGHMGFIEEPETTAQHLLEFSRRVFKK